MKNFYQYLNENKENKEEITIRDYTWLYFLVILYGGKMLVKSWEKDDRPGVLITTSFDKFDFVYIENGNFVVKNQEEARTEVKKIFYKKTLLKALQYCTELKKYDIKGYYGYQISRIPYDLFLRENPNIDKSFRLIENRIVNHFNSQVSNTRIITQLSKSRNLKDFNLMKLFQKYEYIPKEIKIYRGLKQAYDIEQDRIFSCWTTNKGQAERFAKYYFTGTYQNPILSELPHVLETTIPVSEIIIFVDGQESEVILKNPVLIDNEYSLSI